MRNVHGGEFICFQQSRRCTFVQARPARTDSKNPSAALSAARLRGRRCVMPPKNPVPGFPEKSPLSAPAVPRPNSTNCDVGSSAFSRTNFAEGKVALGTSPPHGGEARVSAGTGFPPKRRPYCDAINKTGHKGERSPPSAPRGLFCHKLTRMPYCSCPAADIMSDNKYVFVSIRSQKNTGG